MVNEINTDIVIIGAGLTGLVTGFYLTQAGKKVTILEKSNRVGGVINTQDENGFVFETGPNSGVLASTEAVTLFRDLKGKCELEIANPESKKRLIWKNGKWEALPSGIISGITTPLFSLKDKFRIMGEPFRKKGDNPDESVAELVVRRLGKSFLDYAVDPFISGIYAGNPNLIITKYALPKLYNLEQNFGSFILGAIKNKAEALPDPSLKATREVFSVVGGLKNMIDSLESSFGNESIFLNCENININPVNNHYSINFTKECMEFNVNAGKVLTTIGGYALPDLLPFIHGNEMDSISNLEYARVVQVVLGYKEWKGIALDAFGGLVPSIEKRKILGVLFSSSIFKNRAPTGGALLSIFLGGMRNPDAIKMSDSEIAQLVLSEIKEMMKLDNPEPDLLKIFRYHNAIPQYGKSSGERLQKISEIENRYPGLILAGNIRDGIGMSDRIKQAKQIAEKI